MKDMLAGIKVLDLTNNLAGPMATGMMADYGAEVIHVEKPKKGDDGRDYPPKVDGVSLAFAWINRGKRSIAIDMKDPQGIELIKKLAADADILVESNRTGVMAKLGLDYEVIKEINPGIIYCSVTIFGQQGPYAKRAGYDIIAQAYSGFMHLTGFPDGPPAKSIFAIGDLFGAFNAYGSVMTALIYKQKTGIGQHIDVSLARSLFFGNTPFDRLNSGVHSKRAGNHDPALNPYGVYAGSNDQSIVIAATSPLIWASLCKLMDREDMINDPRYCENVLRAKNQMEIIPVIEGWLKTFDDIGEAAQLMTNAGIPNIKVYTNDDIANDPHAREMGWIVDAPVPDGVTSMQTFMTRNVAATFSETPGTIKKAPSLGEANYEILSKYGLSPVEIDGLHEKWKVDVKRN